MGTSAEDPRESSLVERLFPGEDEMVSLIVYLQKPLAPGSLTGEVHEVLRGGNGR